MIGMPSPRRTRARRQEPDERRGLFRIRMVLWASLFTVSSLGGWAAYAEIDQVTRAPGQVIAGSRTQIIQSPEGGILEDLRVREGDTVERGQLLARLDRTKNEAIYLETRAKAGALRASVARLRAETMGGDPVFPADVQRDYPHFVQNQLTLLRNRRAAIDQDIESLMQLQKLAQEELAMTMPLAATGDVSQAELLKIQRQAADLQAQITNKRNKYVQDTQAELGKVEEELASAEQALAQRKDQLDHLELRAPMNGVVKNVRITTRGGVVKPTEEVMQIVPIEDDLLIEAKVRPADIAFIKPGLGANVKIDAYDYTIYGSLDGTVAYISADTLDENLKQGEQAYYRVQVRTQGKRFSGRPEEKLEIQPGMTATIEIKTGKNTVLRYLAKPVIKTVSESMGER